MLCQRCGRSYQAGQRFCTHCGAVLIEHTPAKRRRHGLLVVTLVVGVLLIGAGLAFYLTHSINETGQSSSQLPKPQVVESAQATTDTNGFAQFRSNLLQRPIEIRVQNTSGTAIQGAETRYETDGNFLFAWASAPGYYVARQVKPITEAQAAASSYGVIALADDNLLSLGLSLIPIGAALFVKAPATEAKPAECFENAPGFVPRIVQGVLKELVGLIVEQSKRQSLEGRVVTVCSEAAKELGSAEPFDIELPDPSVPIDSTELTKELIDSGFSEAMQYAYGYFASHHGTLHIVSMGSPITTPTKQPTQQGNPTTGTQNCDRQLHFEANPPADPPLRGSTLEYWGNLAKAQGLAPMPASPVSFLAASDYQEAIGKQKTFCVNLDSDAGFAQFLIDNTSTNRLLSNPILQYEIRNPNGEIIQNGSLGNRQTAELIVSDQGDPKISSGIWKVTLSTSNDAKAEILVKTVRRPQTPEVALLATESPQGQGETVLPGVFDIMRTEDQQGNLKVTLAFLPDDWFPNAYEVGFGLFMKGENGHIQDVKGQIIGDNGTLADPQQVQQQVNQIPDLVCKPFKWFLGDELDLCSKALQVLRVLVTASSPVLNEQDIVARFPAGAHGTSMVVSPLPGQGALTSFTVRDCGLDSVWAILFLKHRENDEAESAYLEIPIQHAGGVSSGCGPKPGASASDAFDNGLNAWSYEKLNTWATYSFDHGITDDGTGDHVVYMKGGIPNGGGGGQVLVRPDLAGSDMAVSARIKMIPATNYDNSFGNPPVVSAGITTRYQSIGKGYAAWYTWTISNSVIQLFLYRLDGTAPGPNYEYMTVTTALGGPLTLQSFDPSQWHIIELDTSGQQISVKLDGQVYLQASDTKYSQGAPGLVFAGSNGGGWAYYDDFAVSQGQQPSGSPTGLPNLVWRDGFESYASGSWPSAWVADANAGDSSNNYVDNTIQYEGTKSLRLFGDIGGCWGALAYHPLNVAPAYEIELAVRNGSETLSGCHPDRGYIGIRQGTSWSNPARSFLAFKGDGTIISGSGKVLGNYSPLTWYKIRIRYERPSPSQVKLSYWIDGVFAGSEMLNAISSEDQLTNLDLTVQEGSAWFDDIGITLVNQESTQGSPASSGKTHTSGPQSEVGQPEQTAGPGENRQIHVPASFATIQQAIDAAAEQAVITIDPGTYQENITIKKPVTLVGSDAKGVQIEGALSITDSQLVTVSHMSVTGGEGILVEDSKTVILDDLAVSQSDLGIKVSGSSEVQIRNCNINQTRDAIYLQDSARAEITGCTIADAIYFTVENVGGAKGSGIVLLDSSRATITDCHISGVGFGIELWGSSWAEVSNCSIHDNENSGVKIEKFAYAKIKNSTMEGNKAHGVELRDSSRADIVDSEIAGNGLGGVWLYMSPQATLERNNIQGNGEYGVGLHLPPCFPFRTEVAFTGGQISGAKNVIPSLGENHGNKKGGVCPAGLGFLMTEKGGGYPINEYHPNQ